ncbi:TetR/AcrR family transcriptional regulator [Spongiactinospora sp. TRM90649]|uniref:TetR/AcrR family transcriptional regulator n=1 Tax=Spongiactinospora sp. TRM90649 TaxID=3031114 RepID=UPI0023F6BD5A|nr:TetR/AcrR family transcriptional regulator [Spongiactinospora sp. TRM90649]MDF5757235.1 TetR/AcrR family transcriptional regulator [Spongiactinospora sp. TRM90649]
MAQAEGRDDDPPKRSFIEQARRAQIVASAIEVLAEVGYGAASLTLIAKRAGISKGVISYHFTSKNELMEEVVDSIYAETVAFVLERMEGERSAAVLLRTQILGAAEHMRDHREQIQALHEIFNHMRAPGGGLRYGMEANEGLYRSLEDIYRLGQSTGEFRDFDIRVMAVTHNAAIEHMFAYWVTHPGHDIDTHARELADHFDRATRGGDPP